jgi:hypothetical protein
MDVLALRRLSNDGEVVIQPSQFDDGRGVLASVMLPGSEKSWVVEGNSGLVGFAHARPRRYVLGWELVHVQHRRDYPAQDVVSALVKEVLQYLQNRGIPRLFARTPESSVGHDILLDCGFTPLLSEIVYVRSAQSGQPPEETPVGMRYRMPQDAWPLRQLENGQTPLLISQLEGLTSANWSLPKRRLQKDELTDLVVERDGEIVGWVGWSPFGTATGLREHVRLGIMTSTDQPEIIAPLLDYALYVIGSKRPNAEVVIRLREYQSSAFSALIERGFTEVARDTLFIKHGRLQVVTKRIGKLFELAPTVQAFSLKPTTESAKI